ncbi:MAG: hypothetical protein U0457_10145 [Candidatus Sericytochromatia bacterium]
MDVNDFQTIGECELGFTWMVSSENKVVVNVGKVALYFEIEEFFHFAKMIDESAKNLAQITKPQTTEVKKTKESKIASISKFRASKDNEE